MCIWKRNITNIWTLEDLEWLTIKGRSEVWSLNDQLWLDELDAHQRECQRLEETEDSQIPIVVEDNDGVLREMVRTLTSSDSHDSIETESEDNSIVALPCEICDELRPSDKLMEHQEKCIQEREGIQRSGSASEKNVCTQAILLTSGSGDSINVFEITAVKVKP